METIRSYTRFGGAHAETAALTNVLAAAGVRAPHTGQPFSEAMIFGIGGGPGAGYILWEFQGNNHSAKVLVLAFQHLWQYPMRFYQGLCDRIGVTISMPETGSRKAAGEMLQAALAQGMGAAAWVDRAHMPYLHLPEMLKGRIGHIVAVCGRDGEDMLIDDRAAAPFRMGEGELADARGRITSYKNRLLLVEGISNCDLPGAIQAGLRACVEHLSSPSDSFSLPAIRKWGKMMTDTKNSKGWPRLFGDGRGLFSVLRSAFEGTALNEGEGGLRGLYARFLEEAAGVTGNAGLRSAADQYRGLAQRWEAFVEAVLPDEVEPFAEAKGLLRRRHAAILMGGEAWRGSQAENEALEAVHARVKQEFPLDEAGVKRLFEGMQGHLMGLYAAETAALEGLREAVR
jgi:hypothetical protein